MSSWSVLFGLVTQKSYLVCFSSYNQVHIGDGFFVDVTRGIWRRIPSYWWYFLRMGRVFGIIRRNPWFDDIPPHLVYLNRRSPVLSRWYAGHLKCLTLITGLTKNPKKDPSNISLYMFPWAGGEAPLVQSAAGRGLGSAFCG